MTEQVQAKKPHIFLTGGGTLGHVMPNLPLIDYYLAQGWEVSYIGSKTGPERAAIEQITGITYHPVRTGKLRRYFDFQNFLDLFNVSIAVMQCFFLFRKYKPTVLFSKGGYVALPPVVAARLTKVPSVIHESDKSPGLTTNLSKRFAQKICVAFQDTARYFEPQKVVYTGLPVRNLVFEANKNRGLELIGFDGNRPILLVFGGSLGAGFLNKLTRENIANGNLDAYDVVNICGKGNLDTQINTTNYQQFESLGDDFLHIMQAADIVLTRGGATSLFELLAMQKPHIIIPLSKKASRGDQIENAQYFASLGVSTYLEEENYTWTKLAVLLDQTLFNWNTTLLQIQKLAFDQATQKVITVINEVATQK